MDSQTIDLGLHNVALEENTFFKFMSRKDYSELMFLPPKFAETLRALVGEKIQIKNNMNGQKWDVKISLVDGYLAFEEGWPVFSKGNDLGDGDMLIFYYVRGSHFTVDIFKRLTVCQKQVYTKGSTERNKMLKRKKRAQK